MPILHTVNKSPFLTTTLESCLRLAQPGSTILLIEDGVYALLSPLLNEYSNLSFYALAADVQARGLSDRLPAHIQLVDDQGFVQLTVEHDRVESWS